MSNSWHLEFFYPPQKTTVFCRRCVCVLLDVVYSSERWGFCRISILAILNNTRLFSWKVEELRTFKLLLTRRQVQRGSILQHALRRFARLALARNFFQIIWDSFWHILSRSDVSSRCSWEVISKSKCKNYNFTNVLTCRVVNWIFSRNTSSR